MSRLAEIALAQFELRVYRPSARYIVCGKLYAGGAVPVLRCLEPLAHDAGTRPTAHSHAGASWWNEKCDHPPGEKK